MADILEADVKKKIFCNQKLELEHDTVFGFLEEFRIGFGRCDLLGMSDKTKTIYVIEIKSACINGKALEQLSKYVAHMRRKMEFIPKYSEYSVKGILIGRSTTSEGALMLLSDDIIYIKFDDQLNFEQKPFEYREQFIHKLKSQAVYSGGYLDFLSGKTKEKED